MMLKRFTLFALLLCSAGLAKAQTVNGIPLKDIKVEYVQIVGTTKLLNNKLTIEIDFGQSNSYWTNKDTQMLDENRKKIEFNSMIDALNFMSANGYDFVTAYTVTISSNQSVYHYLMRRKK